MFDIIIVHSNKINKLHNLFRFDFLSIALSQTRMLGLGGKGRKHKVGGMAALLHRQLGDHNIDGVNSFP